MKRRASTHKKKSHKKKTSRHRMRGGMNVLGVDLPIQSTVSSLIAGIISDQTMKDNITRAAAALDKDYKPSKIIKDTAIPAGPFAKVTNTMGIRDKLMEAAKELKDGVADGLASYGFGYKKRRSHKKKSHKKKAHKRR